jgi:hypothetical protein
MYCEEHDSFSGSLLMNEGEILVYFKAHDVIQFIPLLFNHDGSTAQFITLD